VSTEGVAAAETGALGAGVLRNPRGILALLTALNLLNYLDRYVVSAVLARIQDDLHLSNAVGGLLVPTFLIGYCTTSPIFGILADRAGTGGRKRLLTVGVAIWSVATAATGLAKGLGSLLLARAVVGVGEASYASIAPTLIDDMATPTQKARRMAVFNAAIPMGSALGYIAGGLLERAHGWRSAFFVVGGPGIVAALLCLLIAEPARHSLSAVSILRSVRALFGARLYWRTVLGYCAYTFAIGGFAAWAPTYVYRRYARYGIELGKASFWFGIITVLAGVAGTLLGGWLADRRTRGRAPGDHEAAGTHASLWVCGLSAGVGAPLALAAILAGSPGLFFALALASQIALFMSSGPVNVVLLRSAPPAVRAGAMAVAIFSIHVFGDAWSPLLIGLLADHVPWALAMMVVPVFFVLASFVWWRASARLTSTVAVR
jgi:MFS family permease